MKRWSERGSFCRQAVCRSADWRHCPHRSAQRRVPPAAVFIHTLCLVCLWLPCVKWTQRCPHRTVPRNTISGCSPCLILTLALGGFPLEVYKINRFVSPPPGWLLRNGALLLRFSVSSCAPQKNNLSRCCLSCNFGRLACFERQARFDTLQLAAHGHIVSVYIGVYPSRYPRAPFVPAVRHPRLIRLVVWRRQPRSDETHPTALRI